MTVIPRGVIDAYTESLNNLSAATQMTVELQLESITYTDEADLREQTIKILEETLANATNQAAGYAAKSYDSIRELAVGSANNAIADSRRIPKATEEAVHGLIEKFKKNGFESYKRHILERCDYEIKRAAGECSLYNARRDTRKPRFARVPSGAETCTFCLMLASRGFVYHSEATAGLDHYHPNCNCRIAPGFDGMEIEGYDPDELYRIWKRTQDAKTISSKFYEGNVQTILKKDKELERELEKQWAAFKSSAKQATDYQATYGECVRSHSVVGKIDIEDFTKIYGKELQLGKWFSGLGTKIKYRNPNTSKTKKTCDTYMNDELWEFKQLTTSSVRKVKQRLDEAMQQSSKVVLDMSRSSMDIEDIEVTVARMLEDPKLEKVIIVKSGKAIEIKK